MLDERDEVLAEQLDKLFTAGDPVTARRNFDAARSRDRRRRQLTATMACVALLAAGAVGVVAVRRDSRPVQVSVVDKPASPSSTTDTSASAAVTSEPALLDHAPLASEVEGRIYGSPALQVSGERLPRTEESPGLAGVQLSFYGGAIAGNNG